MEVKMASNVYGSSDDLIEFSGDVYGEVGCYGTDDNEHGVLVIFSDGTLLEVKYGKCDMGIWGITLIQKGSLFDKIEPCMDENAKPYSDIAIFKDGLKWAYASKEWEKVK
ncbi:MAG: hypothetical protein WC648_05385 [Candidatus Paceibacterota bacterium]|jgi:hypothetical protein